jgi:hypothetical protein
MTIHTERRASLRRLNQPSSRRTGRLRKYRNGGTERVEFRTSVANETRLQIQCLYRGRFIRLPSSVEFRPAVSGLDHLAGTPYTEPRRLNRGSNLR